MGFLDMKAAFSAGGLSIAPARLCDSCQSSTAVIFCRVDSAFLCISCDSKLHSFNKMTHARVWMCEVCEQAPAAFTCKADAAALCVQCDFDIHSANPLARRHERVPVEPFYDSASAAADDSAVVKSSALDFFGGHGSGSSDLGSQSCDLDAPNWNMNSSNSKLLGNSVKNGDLFFSEMDNFLDFEFQSYQQHQQDITADSVVPAPPTKPTYAVPKATLINHSSENCFEIDFGRSKISPFNLSNHSITQSVSSSEIGVVSDGNSMSEISHPFGRNASSVPDSCVSGSTNQICGLDREARVLRYREKRKKRKFEKTIRYASRKAYAETRPRIKGRFAKRTEIGSEIDQIYGTSSPVAFGVVPTF